MRLQNDDSIALKQPRGYSECGALSPRTGACRSRQMFNGPHHLRPGARTHLHLTSNMIFSVGTICGEDYDWEIMWLQKTCLFYNLQIAVRIVYVWEFLCSEKIRPTAFNDKTFVNTNIGNEWNGRRLYCINSN